MKAPQVIFFFVIANVALAILTWAVFMRTIQHSTANLRQITRMQESRLHIYHQMGQADVDATTRAFFLYEIPHAMAAINHEAARLNLTEILFASTQPIAHPLDPWGTQHLYELRITAVYEGNETNLAQFLTFLTQITHPQEVTIEWLPQNNRARLIFSLIAI